MLVQVDIRLYVYLVSSICMMWQNEFYLYCNVEAGWGGQAAGPSQAAKFLPGWCPVSCCRPCFAAAALWTEFLMS